MRPLHLRGVALPDEEAGDWYVVDGRWSRTPAADAATVADGGYLVPGLVDAHCHVGLTTEGPVSTTAEAREQAVTNRDRGALLLRDAGVPVRFAELADDPDLPRILHAGRHIAPPKRYFRGYPVEVEPAQLPDAVEVQARVGDGWVKLVGDWIDRSVGDLMPNWPADALAAAVTRAHAAGARVAVHTFGEETIPDLLAAGVDSIEHGTGLATEFVDRMVETGAALIPTLQVVDTFGEIADQAAKYPAYAARMRRLQEANRERLCVAHEAGVPIYVGTDAGGGLAHGLVVDEIGRLAETCMTPAEALAAGSWKAREWLGLPGIEEGAPADAVVYDADPRRDLGVLRNPRRIIIRGRVVA